jgi:hypothetical protein
MDRYHLLSPSCRAIILEQPLLVYSRSNSTARPARHASWKSQPIVLSAQQAPSLVSVITSGKYPFHCVRYLLLLRGLANQSVHREIALVHYKCEMRWCIADNCLYEFEASLCEDLYQLGNPSWLWSFILSLSTSHSAFQLCLHRPFLEAN